MEPEFGLTVIVPVFNGGDAVREVARQVADLAIEGGHELILVNDGSRDDSAAVCAELARDTEFPVTFIDLARNFGEHNAVMAGLREARGEYVINIDDDLQNPPAEIVRLYEFARQGRYDVVYTYFPQKEHSLWRNFGSWLTRVVSDRLLDKPKGLYLSSFRCVRAFVVRAICEYEGAFPYIDGMILQVTQNIGQVEVEHVARKEGESGYTLRQLVRLWTNMFVNFSIMPLRISMALGFVLGGFGLLGGLWVISEYFVLGHPRGWASLMCSLFIFCGTQLLILGIAGEYLGRLYLNANKRPQYVIRNVVRSRD